MPRARRVAAAAALPVLLTLTACVPEPEIIVRTVEVVCPPRPPEALPCPVAMEGDTLGATIETLRRRVECMDERVKAWEDGWAGCQVVSP